MLTVILVIHLMVVLALIGVVLLQRSEGGGLGIGGGSGFMTARGAANALTRATAILAAAFFITSLALSILARYGERPIDILNDLPPPTTNNGVLDQLGGQNTPATPAPTQPAAPANPPANGAPAAQPSPQTPPASDGAATTPATPAPAQPAPAPAPDPAPAQPAVPNN